MCDLGLPIVKYPEEAAEQVDEEDKAMREHGTSDMEEFREYGLDGLRTADDQNCFSKFIVVRTLKKSAGDMRHQIFIFYEHGAHNLPGR